MESTSPEQMWIALHELRLHQIELEVQNEELRRAQLATEAARARYLDLYDTAPVGYLVLNENGTILEANQRAAAMLGSGQRALLKHPLTRFIFRDDQDRLYLLRKRIESSGGAQACELRIARADGGVAHVHLTAAVQIDNGVRQLRVVLNDLDLPGQTARTLLPAPAPAPVDSLQYARLDAGRRSCFRCGLRESCLPRSLGPGDLQVLDRYIENARPLAARQTLVRSNEIMRCIYVVRSGALKSTIVQANGEVQIIALHLPGELICPEALYQQQYRCDVEALQRSQLCALPYERLRELAERMPALQAQLMHMLTREMVHDHDHLIAMGQRTALHRVVRFLRSLSQRRLRQHLDPSELQLPMTRAEIGNFLNLAEETVCRTLGQLQREGVISVSGKQLRVHDQDALVSLCEEPAETAHTASS